MNQAQRAFQLLRHHVDDAWKPATVVSPSGTTLNNYKAVVLTPPLRAKILAATRRKPKDGSSHWSCRKLAAAIGVSKDMVRRVGANPD
jgi:hypothetical protein